VEVYNDININIIAKSLKKLSMYPGRVTKQVLAGADAVRPPQNQDMKCHPNKGASQL
jgi:hypothetical protein